MLTLFFTIIFIAEVIIAFQIIHCIICADKAVKILSVKIIGVQPEIKLALYNFRIAVNKGLSGVYKLAEILEKQKQKAKNAIIKNLIITVLFLFLNPKGKQIFSTADLIITLKDIIRGVNWSKLFA